jgi:hypothetical protein
MTTYKVPKKVPTVVVGEESAKEVLRKTAVSAGYVRSQEYPPTQNHWYQNPWHWRSY